MTRGRKNPLHYGLADRIKEERQRQSFTIRSLAQRAGVAAGTVHATETGHHLVSLDIAEKLAKALGVSPCWLCFGLGPKEAPTLRHRRKASSVANWLQGLPDTRGQEAATLLRGAYGLGEPSDDVDVVDGEKTDVDG